MLPERSEETTSWLGKAKQDLRVAEVLFAEKPPLLEPALFHCQQAAEKALKAYLAWQEMPFHKTHDLVALLALCTKTEPAFTSIEDAAIALTPYAVAFRYPGELTPPTVKQSRDALRLAHEILSFVSDRLPPEVRQ